MPVKRKGPGRSRGWLKGMAVSFAVCAGMLCILSILVQKGTLTEESMKLTGGAALCAASLAGCMCAAKGSRGVLQGFVPAAALAAVIAAGAILRGSEAVRGSFTLTAVLCVLAPGAFVGLLKRRRKG